MSERRDSNPESPVPKTGMLPLHHAPVLPRRSSEGAEAGQDFRNLRCSSLSQNNVL